jgi:hypothetical protein
MQCKKYATAMQMCMVLIIFASEAEKRADATEACPKQGILALKNWF